MSSRVAVPRMAIAAIWMRNGNPRPQSSPAASRYWRVGNTFFMNKPVMPTKPWAANFYRLIANRRLGHCPSAFSCFPGQE